MNANARPNTEPPAWEPYRAWCGEVAQLEMPVEPAKATDDIAAARYLGETAEMVEKAISDFGDFLLAVQRTTGRYIAGNADPTLMVRLELSHALHTLTEPMHAAAAALRGDARDELERRLPAYTGQAGRR